jgi:hypothetical protein
MKLSYQLKENLTFLAVTGVSIIGLMILLTFTIGAWAIGIAQIFEWIFN